MEAHEPLLDSPRQSTEHHRHAEQIEHMEPLAVGGKRPIHTIPIYPLFAS